MQSAAAPLAKNHASHDAKTASGPFFSGNALLGQLERIRETVHVVEDASGARGIAYGDIPQTVRHLGTLPATYPEWLGDRSFCNVHGTRFPYVAGAMANGIATVDLVVAMADAGMLGFFGSAGLPRERVSAAFEELRSRLGSGDVDKGEKPWGMNLIHSPHEPDLEQAIVDLYLDNKVRRVSASAYMDLTPMVVQYAATGLVEVDGQVHRKNFVFAKISRAEVAGRFLAPAPDAMLQKLVDAGRLTADEARLAKRVPVAEDITVESDSGGHTDNQILTAVFPTVLALKEQLAAKHQYQRPIRVGAAGGLGTPSAAAAAFGLGAAYILTGSVNQGAVESGLHPEGRKLLATADVGDVIMAPAADMFELGVKVQVLRRGTLFAQRAARLYELYRAYPSMDAIPAKDRAQVEKQIFQSTFEQMWESTAAFFKVRDPAQIDAAEKDPKHKMALVFRAYLGQSSRWAIAGDAQRKLDFQIWCGPAMGAFNAWVKGTFLDPPASRTATQIARNILEGAAVISRAQALRALGVAIPDAGFAFAPRPLN